MSKEDILEAVISIGSALSNAKWERERQQREKENINRRVKMSYPVGTKLFSFSYEDGVEEAEVIDEDRIKIDGRVRYSMDYDTFSETFDGAIKAEIDRWIADGELNFAEDVEHFECLINYHGKLLDSSQKALKIIKLLKAT